MKTVPLGELVKFTGGGTPSRDRPEYWGGSIPWVSCKDLNGTLSLYAAKETITERGLESSASNLIPPRSLLVATRMSLGKAVINEVQVAINQDLKAAICKPALHVRYLLWFWLSRAAVISRMGSGATVKGITLDQINDLKIPLPSLGAQRRIAAILDKADAIRRKREQAIQLADEFLQSLFLDMFGDPITNSKHLGVESLGLHLTFLTSGSRGWARYYSNSGPQFVRSLDVQMNNLRVDDCAYVKPPAGAETERTRVRPGDVLLTITGSRIGRVATVPSAFGEAYASQHVAILRLTDDLLPEYLSMFLSLERGGQIQIARNQYGQTKPGLNLEQIREFQIPVPPLSEQRQFIAVLRKTERLKLQIAAHQRTVDLLLATLQKSMFRS